MAEAGGDASEAAITVQNLAGATIVIIEPPTPETVKELKFAIEATCSVPSLCQTLLHGPESILLKDDEVLDKAISCVTLVHDETTMFSWDLEGNPDKAQLVVDGDGTHVHFTNAQSDYCNVLTIEPIRSDVHFFEFVMHHIGDEQWCGVTPCKELAGTTTSGHSSSLTGCFYNIDGRPVCNGPPAQPKGGRKKYARVGSGDVIGMLVDMDKRKLAFTLNGVFQGVCATPEGPLYVLTHVDTRLDHVELRKPSVTDVSPEVLEAIRN
eukprot:TRINITY_DN5728_c0_g1_i1.p1 TRINITY_DN5728_c0_g1~~TRINITY_DN5728_c0_g1_i1.p1  ORF type:complete len:288 (-),score=38.55 TRINITY_DN5728_c0_g1_i1:107-904(-)